MYCKCMIGGTCNEVIDFAMEVCRETVGDVSNTSCLVDVLQ